MESLRNGYSPYRRILTGDGFAEHNAETKRGDQGANPEGSAGVDRPAFALLCVMMVHMADVLVHWDRLPDEHDQRWDWCRVLYGYIAPPHGEIVYLGKADHCSVRERWSYTAKGKMWDALNRAGISAHGLIVGDIELARGRLTGALLSDVESLLIYNVQPRANTACRQLRITRPGLSVEYVGAWPFRRR